MTRTLTQLPEHSLDLGDRTVIVRVRGSETARTSRILVGPQRPLEIIVPAGTPAEHVDKLLAAKREWIVRKLDATQSILDRPPQLGLDAPGAAWLNGEALALVEGNPRKPSVARRSNGVLTVDGPANAAERAIHRWYRREARAAIREEVPRAAQQLGLSYRSVTVRDQRTRWGSCSARGNLSFNWRLIAAPAFVREYVIVHELCHLRVPNHSKAFWTLLDTASPEWRVAADWLHEHGLELQQFRRSLSP